LLSSCIIDDQRERFVVSLLLCPCSSDLYTYGVDDEEDRVLSIFVVEIFYL